MADADLKRLFDDVVDRFPAVKVREFLLAAAGRKTSRTEVPERDIHAFVDLMERHGLNVAIYDRKYVHAPDYSKGGWANQYGLELPLESPHDGYLMVYLADNPGDALAAMRAEHAQQDDLFGELLGIPECCRRSYVERIYLASMQQNDFLPLILDNTASAAPYPYLNNVGAQYFDYCLLSFYPCTFTCQNAAGLAWDTYQFLASVSVDFAEKFLARQRSAIIYTEYEGVYLLGHSTWRNGWLNYSPENVQGTLGGLLFQVLLEGDRLKVVDPHRAVVQRGRRIVQDLRMPDLCVMVFA